MLLIPDAVLGCKLIKSFHKIDLSEAFQEPIEPEHDLDLSAVPGLSGMESRVTDTKQTSVQMKPK